MQIATVKHINHLRATADTENRSALGNGIFQDIELHHIALWIKTHVNHRRALIQPGADIAAAADDKTIKSTQSLT